MIGIITTARHKLIVDDLTRQLADRKAMSAKVFGANVKLARENADLRARLAVFTAPRERDARGRFLSTKGAA